MDDYEKKNAQEWDLNYKDQRTKAQKQNESQVKASNSARRGINITQQQNTPPNASKRPAQSQQQQNTPPGPSRRPNQPQQPRTYGGRPAPRERHPAAHNASAWLVAEGVKRQEQSHREPQPLLVDVGDSVVNAAENAWRSHKLPLASIKVPEELVWGDQEHETYAKKYGTFVFSDDRVGKGGTIKLDIWGEAAAVECTRQAIHKWIERERLSKRALGLNSHPTTKSLTPRQRPGEEKKWIREVMRQRFRREPPIGMLFGAIGTFHWPIKEFQPHELLGNSYEAFDPIRMDCSCYVIYNQDISGFKVMGEAGPVKAALLRIRKACFQITARQIAPVRRYFLHLHETEAEACSHVILTPYEHIKRIGATAATTQYHPGHSPQAQDEADLDTSEQQQHREMSIREAKIAGKTIMLMIAKLHYYRGHLKLRVWLGTFLVMEYRATEDGRYTVEDFRDMLRQSQFVGQVTPELGHRYSETTSLETLRTADWLLDPRNSMDHTLCDVKPIYTAIFTFADRAGDLCLEVSWHEAEDSPGSKKIELRELSRQWTRLDRGSSSQSSLVDISLLNLNNRSAWHFELSASHAVENNRLDSKYHAIANSVRADIHIARQQRTDKPFARCNPYVPLKMLQQRTSYLFALKNSNYTLELTRFQDRVYTHSSNSLREPDCQVYEPRWGLEVYHSMWDTLLTRNEHLAIGDMVDWDDGVKTWFEEDDDMGDLGQVKGERGFEQLVEKLDSVEKLILRSESEMFGGMEVG